MELYERHVTHSQVYTQNFFLAGGGGGWGWLADTDAICNLFDIKQLRHRNHAVSTTQRCLELDVYTCGHNCVFLDSISVPSSCFFNCINFFFKILMYRSSADFSGWFRLKGKSRKIFDNIYKTRFFKFRFWRAWGGVLQPCSPPLGSPLLI
jgi:hypothetical protein